MNRKCLIITACVSLSGCGIETAGPSMADVSGIVKLGGKPLVDAEVFFVTDGFEGYGKTRYDGTYSLVRGAPVGACKVYIRKTPEMPAGGARAIDMSIDGMDPEQLRVMHETSQAEGTKPLLPPEFSDPELTKLSFDVPEGGTDGADFNL